MTTQSAELAKPEDLKPEILSEIVLQGDLSSLKDDEIVEYYRQYCLRLSLDPATQPFQILELNGKKVMYATRACAAQLNRRDAVSHTILSRETKEDCYIVVARAFTATRQEESIGAVAIANLKGEALCNAMMKAETKAKRRSTLDLCGLGMMDEEEVRTVAFSDHNAALESSNVEALQARIDQYNRFMENATQARKQELLGLRSELECRKKDILLQLGALPPSPAGPIEPSAPATTAPKKEVSKPATATAKQPENLPPAAKVTPWQEVVCHVGGPTAKGKTLAFLFDSKRSAKAMKSITEWFAGINQDELTPEDKAKMPALLAAAKEGHAAWEKSNCAVPAEAPQQPATEQGWRGFILQSKDETMNGKKMSELTPTQMKSIGDWLAKVDMKNASLYQKQVAAMYALATGGVVSPELPAHVKELDVKLRESKIEPEVFLREMKNTGLIAESYTSMAEITEPEAREMLGNWTAVVEACDVIDVESTTSK